MAKKACFDEYMTVNEVSKLSGVSVRTLHYYDEIDLLKPSQVLENGYRVYDVDALVKLQDILLFKELAFPLKDIKKIIDNPAFDRLKAIDDQIKLLQLKRGHLDELISFAKRIKEKGEVEMSFETFDKTKIDAYEKLAKEIWGETEAYKEYEKKTCNTSEIEKRTANEKLMDIFFEFGDLKMLDPADEKVQTQVKKLQDFITNNYYNCTNVILKGLGEMYASGGEFTTNIDVAGGKGCAEFVNEAIKIYVK